jgi:hypothetical protein
LAIESVAARLAALDFISEPGEGGRHFPGMSGPFSPLVVQVLITGVGTLFRMRA